LATFNPNDKVALDNLNSWEMHFGGIELQKDITVPPNARSWKLLSLGEVEAQVKSGNHAFCGTDGEGSHASIVIVDDEVRKYVFGLDGQAKKQKILDVAAIKELLTIANKAAFMKKLKDIVATESEKRRLVMLAKEAGIESAEVYKLKAIEELVGTSIS
jgi:hypothetical protein